jgi:hypothetical protein
VKTIILNFIRVVILAFIIAVIALCINTCALQPDHIDYVSGVGLYSVPVSVDEYEDWHDVKFQNGMKIRFTKNGWQNVYYNVLNENNRALNYNIDVRFWPDPNTPGRFLHCVDESGRGQ